MHIQKEKDSKKKTSLINTEYEKTWIDIAKGNSFINEYKKAMSAYNNALVCNPNSVDALYNICQLALVIDDRSKAISLIARLAKLEGESVKYHTLCGHYFLRSDIDRSYKHFVRALGKDKGVDDYLLYGVAAFKDVVGEYSGAYKIFLRRFNEFNFYAHDTIVLFSLGMIHKRMKRNNLAIRMFNILKMMKMSGPLTRNDVEVQIAHVYERQGRDKDAMTILEKILINDNEHMFSNRLCAWIHHKNKDTDEGKKSNIIKALDPYCYYILGRTLIDSGKYEEAIDVLNYALELERGDPWIWNSLGVSYYNLKCYEKAKEMFSASVACDKTNIIYENNVIAACSKLESCDGKEQENLDPGLNKIICNDENVNCGVVDVVPDLFDSCYIDTHLIFGGKIFVKNSIKLKRYEIKIPE